MKDTSSKQILSTLFEPSLNGFIPLVTINTSPALRFTPAEVFKSNSYVNVSFKYRTSASSYDETYSPLPLTVSGIGEQLTGAQPATMSVSSKISEDHISEILDTDGFVGSKLTIYFVQVDYLNNTSVTNVNYENYIYRESNYIIDSLREHNTQVLTFILNPLLFSSNARPLNRQMSGICTFTYRRRNPAWTSSNSAAKWLYTDTNGDSVQCPYTGANKYDVDNELILKSGAADTNPDGETDIPSRDFGCCYARFYTSTPPKLNTNGFTLSGIRAITYVASKDRIFVLTTANAILAYTTAGVADTSFNFTTNPTDTLIDIAGVDTGVDNNDYLFGLSSTKIIRYLITGTAALGTYGGATTIRTLTTTHTSISVHIGVARGNFVIYLLSSSNNIGYFYNHYTTGNLVTRTASRDIENLPNNLINLNSSIDDFRTLGSNAVEYYNTLKEPLTVLNFDHTVSSPISMTQSERHIWIATSGAVVAFNQAVKGTTYPFGGFLGLDNRLY